MSATTRIEYLEDNSSRFPAYLLSLYIFLIYCRPQDILPSLGSFHLHELILGVILIRSLTSGDLARIRFNDSLTKSVLAFTALMFLSIITSIWKKHTLESSVEFSKVAITYILIITTIKNRRDILLFVKTILLSNLFVSLVQLYVFKSVGITRTTGHGGYGFNFAAAAAAPGDYTHGVGGYVYGFLANSSDLGVGMLVVLPLAFYLIKAPNPAKWKMFFAFASLCYLASIICTGSRGAFVGLVGLLAGILLKSRRKFAAVMVLMIVGTGCFYFLSDEYVSRVASIGDYKEDESANIRLELWGAGLNMFADHPVLGVGAGNFSTAYGLEYHGPTEGGVLWWNPHNIFVHVLSELGILGLVCYVFVIVGIFRSNKRIRNLAGSENAVSSPEYLLAVALDVSLIGFLVSGFFITVTYYPHLLYMAALSQIVRMSLDRHGAANMSKTKYQGPD